MSGFDYSRDEQMANFDAWIFSQGHLVWPLPDYWQANAEALNLLFMYPVSQPVAWVSAYLPMNAAIRAGVGMLGDPALTGPILTGLSLPMLWACARRLFPGDREAALVSVVLLACSGQFLMMGMTAFAMPAHLFFNLLWLWLFLLDRRLGDFAAIAVGFVATGLHQPLFHPMFVAPWFVLLLYQRRWDRLAIFAAGYLPICGFWFLWPREMAKLVTGPNAALAASLAKSGYLERLSEAFGQNRDNLRIMAANLFRFIAWQHLLLVPLILASRKTIAANPAAKALAAGLLIPIAVFTVILPWQGMGFGYRYLHPVLGNAALLGGYGWLRCKQWHPQLRSGFVYASVASALILFPVQAWLTHHFVAPMAETSARLDALQADYVIFHDSDAPWAINLLLNRPEPVEPPIAIRLRLHRP